MLINRDGTIDCGVTSETIVELLYRSMFDKYFSEIIKYLNIINTRLILETDELSEEKKEILKFLLGTIIKEGKEEIIKRDHKILDDKYADTICGTLLGQVMYHKDINIINCNLSKKTYANLLKKLIIQFENDEEYLEIIKKYKLNMPIGMYECIIRQLPKELQQELIRHTLEDITLTNNKGLLQVLYSGIGLSLGEWFKSRLQDEDLKDKIYNIINIKDHSNVEDIKKLLIIQGLGIIRKIKKAEEEAYSNLPPKQIGGLDSNINNRIANYNANLYPEPDPDEEELWCKGASSRR